MLELVKTALPREGFYHNAAAGVGVEPTFLELESSVLPLNDPAISFFLIFLYILYHIFLKKSNFLLF